MLQQRFRHLTHTIWRILHAWQPRNHPIPSPLKHTPVPSIKGDTGNAILARILLQWQQQVLYLSAMIHWSFSSMLLSAFSTHSSSMRIQVSQEIPNWLKSFFITSIKRAQSPHSTIHPCQGLQTGKLEVEWCHLKSDKISLLHFVILRSALEFQYT